MPTFDVTSPAIALWSAIATGFVTGLIPIGLAEAAALAIGVVQPTSLALTLLGAFTVAHVAGKVGWYWLGTFADRVTEKHPRTHGFVVKARAVMAEHPAYGAGVLATAALASVPPFHLAAIAAGIARIPFWRFLLICLGGRLVRFALIASVPALLAGACADPGGSRADQIADGAVTIIENTSPARDSSRAWHVPGAPLFTIGAGDPRAATDSLYEFNDISGAYLLGDGRTVIAVMGSGSLRFYDANGSYVKTVGRKGEGPGEFRQIIEFYRTRGDTLAVNDFLVEVEWFTPEGERIDRRARRDDAVQLQTVAAFSDGTHFGIEFAGHAAAGRHRQRMLTVLRADARGRSTDSILTLPGILESTRTPGYGAQPVAFTPTLHFAVLDDSLVTAHSARYQIEVRDRDGVPVRVIRRAWRGQPVGNGLREEFRTKYLDRRTEGGRPQSEEWRRQQQPWLAKDPYADTLPAFQRLVISREGDLWLERYRTSWELVQRTSIGPRVLDEESTWDVFDRSGRWETVVTLPARFTLLDAQGDRLLGLTTNDDGEQGVRALTLVRPP